MATVITSIISIGSPLYHFLYDNSHLTAIESNDIDDMNFTIVNDGNKKADNITILVESINSIVNYTNSHHNIEWISFNETDNNTLMLYLNKLVPGERSTVNIVFNVSKTNYLHDRPQIQGRYDDGTILVKPNGLGPLDELLIYMFKNPLILPLLINGYLIAMVVILILMKKKKNQKSSEAAMLLFFRQMLNDYFSENRNIRSKVKILADVIDLLTFVIEDDSDAYSKEFRDELNEMADNYFLMIVNDKPINSDTVSYFDNLYDQVKLLENMKPDSKGLIYEKLSTIKSNIEKV